MRIMNLKNDVCDDKYLSLFAIKAEAEKIHNLALELEMDKDTKEEWRQYTVLCNFLIEQLKHRPHLDAIKDLKLVFGGNRGLSEENEKLAKKILKSSNASMASSVVPNWGYQPAPVMMGPPMGHSQQFFGYGQPNMPQTNAQGNFQGGCYSCGQFGHMAKDCFSNRGPTNYHSRGRRGGGGGRSFGGRFNHRGEKRRGRN
jgi:hypothetical protein